jgi:hypothetical protein
MDNFIKLFSQKHYKIITKKNCKTVFRLKKHYTKLLQLVINLLIFYFYKVLLF